VYNAYRRTGWKIDYNDVQFYKHEIQFSGLIGGEDGNYENFHEFISYDGNPEQIITEQTILKSLSKSLDTLSNDEIRLILAIFVEKKRVCTCARELNISHVAVIKRMNRIREKIKKSMNFDF
jgi:DNA-directed RNA polymerase specialized sigma subunit